MEAWRKLATRAEISKRNPSNQHSHTLDTFWRVFGCSIQDITINDSCQVRCQECLFHEWRSSTSMYVLEIWIKIVNKSFIRHDSEFFYFLAEGGGGHSWERVNRFYFWFSGKNDHSNESYWAVLSCGAVYYAVQSGSNVWVCGANPKAWPFKWNLMSSTFLLYCLLCCKRWF